MQGVPAVVTRGSRASGVTFRTPPTGSTPTLDFAWVIIGVVVDVELDDVGYVCKVVSDALFVETCGQRDKESRTRWLLRRVGKKVTSNLAWVATTAVPKPLPPSGKTYTR